MCAGFQGFYDGMQTKIVQTVLAAAIMFYIREKAYTATRAVRMLSIVSCKCGFVNTTSSCFAVRAGLHVHAFVRL